MLLLFLLEIKALLMSLTCSAVFKGHLLRQGDSLSLSQKSRVLAQRDGL